MKRISVLDNRVRSVLKWFSEVFSDSADTVFEKMFLCKIVEENQQFYLEFSNDLHFCWFILVTTQGDRDNKYVYTFDFNTSSTLQ